MRITPLQSKRSRPGVEELQLLTHYVSVNVTAAAHLRLSQHGSWEKHLKSFTSERKYAWCLIAFTDKGEIVLLFWLYLQAKLAGVFQRWSIFLLCFSLCLFLRQLTSPKWICAIHHSLTELGEQFHYSLALFLYSTVEMSKGFFWTCLVA